MTEAPTIVVEINEAVAVVTLNRPAAMNALSKGLRKALSDTLQALDADEAVRAIILTGAGERAFSAGLDLKELGAAQGAVFDAVGFDPDCNPIKAMERCSKPIIGAVNGLAVTGGLELALACDLLIASTSARFADTHAKVGVMPGWGVSQRLSRLIGSGRAKQMSLTGMFVDALTAADWGLVNQAVPPEDLLAVAKDIARQIAAADPQIISRYKTIIDTGFALPLGEALAYEQEEAMRFNGAVDAGDLEARRESIRRGNRS
jgi:enoyl-CoA hydratase